MSAHQQLVAIFNRFASDNRPAYFHRDETLSYADLFTIAGRLSVTLADEGRGPVVLWGHKDPTCIVGYWACIRSGRAIVPIESDTPIQRLADVVSRTGASLILSAGELGITQDACGVPVINVADFTRNSIDRTERAIDIDDEDIAYIMSSSGTSGAPKAIQVTYSNLLGFVSWLSEVFPSGERFAAVTGNVRHCFDVSLFELWTAWTRRLPISAMDHSEFINSRLYISRFASHEVGLWVSTPSAIQSYLKDPSFNAENLPRLTRFLFCGEVLSKSVVQTIWQRFPSARIINTYGPTECTVAVTSVDISSEHLAHESSLPIGYARPGVDLDLVDGEIFIRGGAVGPGYIGLPERQAYAFPESTTYRTGDKGSVNGQGLWYFHGRNDREIKLQGIRIDLNEVEEQLRTVAGVDAALVEPQVIKGQARSLVAYVHGPRCTTALRDIARAMSAEVPKHMVPRHWYCCDQIYFNQNMKIARQETISAAIERGLSYVHA